MYLENKLNKEGELSKKREKIVERKHLNLVGKKLISPKKIRTKLKRIPNSIYGNTLEALIGAIYRCFDSIIEVNLWLDNIWKKDAELYLKAPYKFNAKSALQEWCQSHGFDLPIYKIYEVSQIHGDPKRFSCEIYLNGSKEASSFGNSHKKAEKKAASSLMEKILNEVRK